MNFKNKKHKLIIVGVSIGIIYGLLTRFLFDYNEHTKQSYALASITFMFIIPTVLGIIPLMFVDNDHLKSYKKIIFIPWLTVGGFFLTMFILGLEGFMCLLILGGPFFFLGTLGAFMYRYAKINENKNNAKLLTILLIPFFIAPIEEYINSPSDIYTINSEVIISASREKIWNNIVEVKEIKNAEYEVGFFNLMGIPKPISATVDKRQIGGNRIGNFEGGLKFLESINKYDSLKTVSFDIIVDPKSVRHNVFDQHVLNGNYFSFVEATYNLTPLSNGKVKLNLSSKYRLTSKINFYGNFWGDIILKDFQNRLLNVIRNRCEK